MIVKKVRHLQESGNQCSLQADTFWVVPVYIQCLVLQDINIISETVIKNILSTV